MTRVGLHRRVRIVNRRAGGLWWRLPLALLAWLIVAVPVIIAIAVVVVLRQHAADLPAVPDLDAWDRHAPQTSVILAADGTVLAEIPFRRGEVVGHRMPVTFEQVPELMIQAVLAAEDVRFFAHHGVDARAVIRAALANYRAGRVVEGASTLSQQLARNLLPEAIGNQRTWRRKIREALLARRIERHFSKRRIFEVYVNHVFLGAGAYGVAAAAKQYFSKELSQLALAEAALIAGLIQAPGRADPFKDRGAARRRRDQVLERMARAGFIDEARARAAQQLPIALSPPATRYGGLAAWYTERARQEIADAWPERYQRGGLQIHTAAWPVLALASEQRARERLRRLGGMRSARATSGDQTASDGPQVGAVILDHQTGYVEATVGGRSWDESRFDRATQACRQPGSAFKPIVYAAALQRDVITPGTPLRDAPIAEYDEDRDVHWKPSPAGRSFRGVALAQDALASSLNAAAVDVLDRVGSRAVVELARALGVTTELDEVRPLALGASCVIPLELAGAFASFASGGRRVRPIFVVRVSQPGAASAAEQPGVSSEARLIDRSSPYDSGLTPVARLDRLVARLDEREPRPLDARTAFLISKMLRAVVTRGTATAVRALGRPLAGKTGTTNDNTDAWFVGYSGRVVIAVWVGHDDPEHTLGPRQDGARAALPLWRRLLTLAEGTRPARPLFAHEPPGLVRARVDRETGYLAPPRAGGALELYFKQGTEPNERAGHSPGVPVDLSRAARDF